MCVYIQDTELNESGHPTLCVNIWLPDEQALDNWLCERGFAYLPLGDAQDDPPPEPLQADEKDATPAVSEPSDQPEPEETKTEAVDQSRAPARTVSNTRYSLYCGNRDHILKIECSVYM